MGDSLLKIHTSSADVCWLVWYLLCISLKRSLHWCIWTFIVSFKDHCKHQMPFGSTGTNYWQNEFSPQIPELSCNLNIDHFGDMCVTSEMIILDVNACSNIMHALVTFVAEFPFFTWYCMLICRSLEINTVFLYFNLVTSLASLSYCRTTVHSLNPLRIQKFNRTSRLLGPKGNLR